MVIVGKIECLVDSDEQLLKVWLDKILILKLVFCEGGMVIVVNFSLIFDGVVVLVLMCFFEVE